MFSFFLRRFPDGIAEGAKFFSQAEIFAVGIGHQAGLIQTEAAVSFHIVLGDMDGHYLGQEHIVGAKGFHFFYFALQVGLSATMGQPVTGPGIAVRPVSLNLSTSLPERTPQ